MSLAALWVVALLICGQCVPVDGGTKRSHSKAKRLSESESAGCARVQFLLGDSVTCEQFLVEVSGLKTVGPCCCSLVVLLMLFLWCATSAAVLGVQAASFTYDLGNRGRAFSQ